MKKKLIIFILISISIILIKYFFSNYNIDYEIDNYKVSTKYNDERFYFELNNGKYIFNFDIYRNRSLKYSFIDNIKEIEGTDFYCIYPEIEDMTTYPLCYQNDIIIDYYLIDDPLLENYKSKTISIDKKSDTFAYYNSLGNNTYVALWNYKGFTVMNGKNYKNVDIFTKERYDNTLAYQNENMIYIADYDSDHEYKYIITFDMLNNKRNIISLDVSIDFDSYFVGMIKNYLYVFDNKNSTLYEINIKNGSTKIKGNTEKGFIKYVDGKEVSCSKKEYKTDKIKYEKNISKYIYQIDKDGVLKTIKDNTSINSKILNKEITFVHEYQNTLYYILDNYLYMYNPIDGNNKILYYFELNFNKDNTMFVYND